MSDVLYILFGFSYFAYVEWSTVLLVWSNPNQANRKSAVQWYFPQWWVFSVLDFVPYTLALYYDKLSKFVNRKWKFYNNWGVFSAQSSIPKGAPYPPPVSFDATMFLRSTRMRRGWTGGGETVWPDCWIVCLILCICNIEKLPKSI